MHTPIFVTLMAAAFTLPAFAAQATDIQNLDQIAHVVSITSGADTVSQELEALGEREGICDGCTIALEDGQSVVAQSGDMVSIIDGKLTLEQ